MHEEKINDALGRSYNRVNQFLTWRIIDVFIQQTNYNLELHIKNLIEEAFDDNSYSVFRSAQSKAGGYVFEISDYIIEDY